MLFIDYRSVFIIVIPEMLINKMAVKWDDCLPLSVYTKFTVPPVLLCVTMTINISYVVSIPPRRRMHNVNRTGPSTEPCGTGIAVCPCIRLATVYPTFHQPTLIRISGTEWIYGRNSNFSKLN